MPAAHGNNLQLALEGLKVSFLAAVHAFFVDHYGNLSGSEAVHERDGILAHEGEESFPHVCTLHFSAAKGIGTVKHHNLNAFLGAGAHHKAKGGDEGVAAGSYVLDVVHHHIYPLEHLRGGLTGGAVKGEDRESGFGVLAAIHMVSGPGVSPHPVLGAVKGHKVHLRGIEEDVYCGAEVPGNAAGIGYKANPLAFEHAEAVLLQNLDSGDNLRMEAETYKGQCNGGYNSFYHKSLKILLRAAGSPEDSSVMEYGPIPVGTSLSVRTRRVWRATAGAGSITSTPGPQMRSMTGLRKG